MRLLHVIGTLSRSYGGPTEALIQLATVLMKKGAQVQIATMDAPTATFPDEIPREIITALGPSLGKYSYNTRLLPWLRANMGNFDAVVVHGIWQYQSLAVWLASRQVHVPYFVFVHGALDPWFKRRYPLKHLKKWLYWPWAEYRVLRDAAGVFFTTEEEMELAKKSFWLYKANPRVINYGISKPPGDPRSQRDLFLGTFPGLRGKRLLLFLGRIDPKKGCDLLLNSFARVASQDEDLHLVMAGPAREVYRSKLERLASELGLQNRITWTGMLSGNMKWGAFGAADVFILPSHSENFGIAVVEALACRVPVLITDKINIWREIGEDNAGIIDTDTADGALRLLQKWQSLPPHERQTMQKNAESCFLRRFDLDFVVRNFIDTIQLAVGKQL